MKWILAIGITTIFSSTALGDSDHHHHKKRHHKAHVHGSGELTLVTDNNDLVIELHAPADDMVGFEHMPKSKEDKEKVASAIKMLKDSSAIFEIPSTAKCTEQKPAVVETELTDQKHKHRDHTEFEVTYSFSCSDVGQLSYLTVLAFKKFSGMKSLKAQGVTATGQFSAKLTPDSPKFELKK
jgi:hypothetical protein